MYIYRDELVLSMSFRRYSFPREKVLIIHRYRHLLKTGLKIKHAVEDYPPYMVFYPADIVEMEEALDANGSFARATLESRAVQRRKGSTSLTRFE